ncbi:uncharacterized protein Z519_06829 [Cladophialophora bantiana CBS 173.52]|uniref:Uncharacterized protein n=1 Tax=Cladophialophora bantiana (strain ATCC 10958 / CBS 173.52 / CDC B-1940 / NIH 8579) TaxID=1442370 RepID=A0A0D2HQ88_CLAB1|nr:uncharacterized protein Z519_06829 [Cladophialophora bantiana CBS 173.52]KIW92980.1 hypothetical protein Z519_06829 [Cladophialophora bantiana CBS 173.52]
MVLANKDWNILCDVGGEPISLEELFAFNDIVWDLRSYGTQILGSFLIKTHGVQDSPVHPFMRIHVRDSLEDECPPGPRQLRAVVDKTHLFSRSLGSRVDPLIQTNGRFCTAGRRGRAEAMMSSLGITEWFKVKPSVENNDLVLHMYPLEFLREAALKIGADFWLASNELPSPWNYSIHSRDWLEPCYHSRTRKPRVTECGPLPAEVHRHVVLANPARWERAHTASGNIRLE